MKEFEFYQEGSDHVIAFDPNAVIAIRRMSGQMHIVLANDRIEISRTHPDCDRLWALLTSASTIPSSDDAT